MESAAAPARSYQTEEEFAQELEVAVSTLRRWHRLRTGPPRTKLGAKIVYDRSLVSEWIKKNAVMITGKMDTGFRRRRKAAATGPGTPASSTPATESEAHPTR